MKDQVGQEEGLLAFLSASGREVGSEVAAAAPPWKVMVVDDDEEVHAVTRLTLRDFSFDGRPLALLHARSAAEAVALFGCHDDVAVAWVDVVMETEGAGLRLVCYVRETLGNRFVRLVLRTGQPGAAPEREVITRYDINDYKEKSELSSLRLYTTMTVALRGYRDIMDLEQARLGLAHLLDEASALFQARSVDEFARVAVEKLLLLLEGGADAEGMYWIHCGSEGQDGRVLAGVGRYAPCVGRYMPACAPALASAVAGPLPCQVDGVTVSIRLSSRYREEHLLYVSLDSQPTSLHQSLIELFHLKAVAALDRLLLQGKSDAAQRLAVRALARFSLELNAARGNTVHGSAGKRQGLTGEMVRAVDSAEYPDFLYQLAVHVEAPEWGESGAAQHVCRIGRYAVHLARLIGQDDAYCTTIERAARLHDVGKLYVPPFSARNWYEPDAMRRKQAMEHTLAGMDWMIDAQQGAVMDMAATIVRHHHEAWNGSGYPDGLAGELIPLAARIVALADFFDISSHAWPDIDRPAFPDAEIFEMIGMASGYYFDPRLVRTFLEHRDEFVVLRDG